MPSIRYPSGRPYTLDWRCRPTTPSGPPPFSDLYSLRLDGVSSYANIGTALNTRFNTTTPFTVSVWVKPTSSVSEHAILSNRNAGAGTYQGILFETYNGNVLFQILNNLSFYLDVRSVETLANNVWTHLVVTWSGSGVASGLKMYANAVALTPAIARNNLTGSAVSSTPLYIGNEPALSLYWAGKMDEMAFWSVALTPVQVTALYNSGHPGDLAAQSNILTWYRLGDPNDTTTTILDRIGSNNATGVNIASGDFTTDVP